MMIIIIRIIISIIMIITIIIIAFCRAFTRSGLQLHPHGRAPLSPQPPKADPLTFIAAAGKHLVATSTAAGRPHVAAAGPRLRVLILARQAGLEHR